MSEAQCAQGICSSCGEFVLLSQSQLMELDEARPFLRLLCHPQMPVGLISAASNPKLFELYQAVDEEDRKFLLQEEGIIGQAIRLCERCLQSLKKSKTPAAALANYNMSPVSCGRNLM